VPHAGRYEVGRAPREVWKDRRGRVQRPPIVFKKPSRDTARDYRRKTETPAEKVDALDQLAQATIVAFDGEEDPNRARVVFTGTFLEDFPMAMNHPKFMTALSALSGLVEEEHEKELGKGVTIKGPSRNGSPKA